MFNLAGNSKLRGIGYKVLNALRPCNILALLAVTVASWVMIVMTGVTGQFFFFDAIAHVFVSSIALFLILTEVQLGPLKRYFARTWPVFSDRHGFLWLGMAMVMLGCDMLANLNKPAFTIKNLGLPLWRVILAAGILSLTFGVFNFAVTLVFRDAAAGLTARMIRADGNLADGGKLGAGVSSASDYYAAPSTARSRFQHAAAKEDDFSATFSTKRSAHDDGGYGDDDDASSAAPGAAAAAANRFRRMTQVFKKNPFGGSTAGGGGPAAKKMVISKPMPVGSFGAEPAAHAPGGGDYYSHTADADTAVDHDEERDLEHGGSTYREDRSSPIIPDIRRPPTALHPAMTGHYSVANMSRF